MSISSAPYTTTPFCFTNFSCGLACYTLPNPSWCQQSILGACQGLSNTARLSSEDATLITYATGPDLPSPGQGDACVAVVYIPPISEPGAALSEDTCIENLRSISKCLDPTTQPADLATTSPQCKQAGGSLNINSCTSTDYGFTNLPLQPAFQVGTPRTLNLTEGITVHEPGAVNEALGEPEYREIGARSGGVRWGPLRSDRG